MKNNKKQDEIQKKLTEKEALSFLAENKSTRKRTQRKTSQKENDALKDHENNIIQEGDVLIADIGGKKLVLDEEKRRAIFEFAMAICDYDDDDITLIKDGQSEEYYLNILRYKTYKILARYLLSAPKEIVLKFVEECCTVHSPTVH